VKFFKPESDSKADLCNFACNQSGDMSTQQLFAAVVLLICMQEAHGSNSVQKLSVLFLSSTMSKANAVTVTIRRI
jgi:hypothetical protein